MVETFRSNSSRVRFDSKATPFDRSSDAFGPGNRLGERFARLGDERLGVNALEGEDHDQELVLLVVEGQHQARDHQRHVGQAERVGVRRVQRLDGPHQVVTEEPDSAAVERMGGVERCDPLGADEIVREPIRVAVVPERPPQRPMGHETEVRVAPKPPLLGRLQEERRTVESLAKLEERRDRRLGVVDEPLDYRDDAPRVSGGAHRAPQARP